MAMNSNLINMAVFSKTFDKVADVVLVVVNSNMTYNKEQLESIAFQIERKFLLKGSMKVNIQYDIGNDSTTKSLYYKKNPKLKEGDIIHLKIQTVNPDNVVIEGVDRK